MANNVENEALVALLRRMLAASRLRTGIRTRKTPYCLLAFFLGAFGAHKFYAGRYGWGIAYAIFFATCVPFIVSLVEAFIAFGKDSDADGNIIW